MESTVGFGLVGAGTIAPIHARALATIPGARLAAITDVSADRLTAFTEEFPCTGYGTLDAMLVDPAVEVVAITAPSSLHFDMAMRAVAAGKHILVEKPPTLSLRDLDTLDAAAQARGVLVGVVLQCRLRPAVLAVQAALAAGRFGRLLQVDTYLKWYRSDAYYGAAPWRALQQAGAGVTMMHAFHYVDLLALFAGPMARVSAQMRNLLHPGVPLEDTVNAFVEYHSGAQGVIQASTAMWPGLNVRVEIHGEHGTAVIAGERIAEWVFREEAPEDAAVRAIGRSDVRTGAAGPADLAIHDHRAVLEDMAEAVRTHRAPAVPLADVRHTLECTLALYRSAALQAPVTFPLSQEEAEVWTAAVH